MRPCGNLPQISIHTTGSIFFLEGSLKSRHYGGLYSPERLPQFEHSRSVVFFFLCLISQEVLHCSPLARRTLDVSSYLKDS
ncbi:MAG: hypothetical protein ACKO9Q_17680 [Pirellula sp.]